METVGSITLTAGGAVKAVKALVYLCDGSQFAAKFEAPVGEITAGFSLPQTRLP